MSDAPKRPLAAIHFQMFSPYIVARLNGAADRMDVVGIEGSRRSAHYAWEPRDGDDRFRRFTLFEDRAIEDLLPAEVIPAMRAALDKLDPAVVVVPGWAQPEALAMLLWARERGRHAVVMSESNAYDARRSPIKEAVKKWLVRQFDSALVGGSPQRDYIEALGMAGERVFVGYDAVDNAYFTEGAAAIRADADRHRTALGLPRDFFLVSCRFIEKKNLARLFDAFAAYRARAEAEAWDLVLVGDGPLRGALEAQAATLGIADAVHFLGFRQYDELPAFYALCGAFVHVSTVEQWGLVVNEAMAAGLPVVVSGTCGCARDLVHDGVNGWQVDPYDTGAITDRLTQIADPGCDRAAMGVRSVEIAGHYGPARFGGGLADAIRAAQARMPRKAGWFTRKLIRRLALRGARAGA